MQNNKKITDDCIRFIFNERHTRNIGNFLHLSNCLQISTTTYNKFRLHPFQHAGWRRDGRGVPKLDPWSTGTIGCPRCSEGMRGMYSHQAITKHESPQELRLLTHAFQHETDNISPMQKSTCLQHQLKSSCLECELCEV